MNVLWQLEITLWQNTNFNHPPDCFMLVNLLNKRHGIILKELYPFNILCNVYIKFHQSGVVVSSYSLLL